MTGPIYKVRGRLLAILAPALFAFIFACAGAFAQNPSQAEIDSWLNQSDAAFGPSPSAPAPQARGAYPGSGGQGSPQMNLRQLFSQMQSPGQGQGVSTTSGTGMAGMPGGGRGQGPFNLTRQDILRIFLGGSPSGGGSETNTASIYSARDALQIARDQAAQAEACLSRARYGSDRGARMNAAAEAQDHANAARGAADRASSIAYGGPSAANDAAAQARAEANRAQAAADRARSAAAGSEW